MRLLVTDNSGIPKGLPSITQTKYVSPAFTGTSDPFYSDIQDAIDACGPASLENQYQVIVYPGLYEEIIFLDDYVHLHFESGAILTPAKITSDINLITCSGVHCQITGQLYLTAWSSAYTVTGILAVNGSKVSVEFDKMNDETNGVVVDATSELNLKCNYLPKIENQGGKIYGNAEYIKRIESSVMGGLMLLEIKRFDSGYFTDGESIIEFQKVIYEPGVEETVYATGGDTTLIDGRISHAGAGYYLARCSGGILRLKHLLLESVSSIAPVYISGGDVITDKCTMTGGTYSVDGSGSGTWRNYMSQADRAHSGSVSPLVDTLTIDSDVV